MVMKAIIMGAAGRDFHNFNTYFRGNPEYEVVAFTAAQISDLDAEAGVESRVYPPELAGLGYPMGIKIYPETMLEQLIDERRVDEVFFAYSDVSHGYVMDEASRVLAAGARSRGQLHPSGARRDDDRAHEARDLRVRFKDGEREEPH
jgi:predicted GTPase